MAEEDVTDPAQLVDFVTAKTPFEAQVILVVLSSAGVPAFVQGGLLSDEVAISKTLMNVQAVTVQVRADQLQAAREALAAAREAGKAMAETTDETAPDETASEAPPPA